MAKLADSVHQHKRGPEYGEQALAPPPPPPFKDPCNAFTNCRRVKNDLNPVVPIIQPASHRPFELCTSSD
eukprot:SAG22_NODE_2019_length_3129_cov_1.934653_7_plen_70_part_00